MKRQAELSSCVWFPDGSVDRAALMGEVTASFLPLGEEVPILVPAYRTDRKGYLGVPRQFGIEYAHKHGISLLDKTSRGRRVTLPGSVAMRDYQVPFIEELLDTAAEEYDFIVKAATGTGKTTMGLRLIQILKLNSIIVVDQENLKDQWIERAREQFGVPEDQIGTVQGPVLDYEGKTIVIAMVQTLVQKALPQKFYDYFGIALFDECFHPSHELLTPEGWRSVATIEADDLVAQVDGASGEITFVRPTDTVARPCTEGLIHFEDKNTDLLATPGHQHLVYWRGEGAPSKVEYGELVPTNRWYQRLSGTVAGTDQLTSWERFLIAYQADGTYLRLASRAQEHHVRFSFRKQRKIDRLLLLLPQINRESAGSVRWEIGQNSRGDTNVQVWCRQSVSKTLDWMPLDKSSSYYRQVMEEAIEWDGWQDAGGTRTYCSTIPANAERMQIAASLAGYVASLRSYGRQNARHATRYQVNWFEGAVRPTKGLRKTHKRYRGMVYCVRVPSGNVLTRRNGKIAVTGNCQIVGAPTFSRSLMMFSAGLRIGMSATPRDDSLQKVVKWSLGEVGAELDKEHRKSKVFYVENESVYSWYANTSPKTGRYLQEISEDANRNWMLCRIIEWLYRTGRDVLAISERIEQLEGIRALCALQGIPESDMGIYTGYRLVWMFEKDPKPLGRPRGWEKGADYTPVHYVAVRKRIPKKTLEHTKDHARVLFATYGMFAKGVDVPRLAAGVDCTPRSKAKQVHGRVLRDSKGKMTPIWVTIRDVYSHRSDFQFLQRLGDYVADNAEIYQWHMDKGVRPSDARALKRAVLQNVSFLKTCRYTTTIDGHGTIQTPSTPTR
jgi:superfamily II DNA or RNA helicase